jgi:hypothetical protein
MGMSGNRMVGSGAGWMAGLAALLLLGCGNDAVGRTAQLNGSNVVPSNGSSASGTALATLDGDRLKITGTFGNLTGDLTETDGAKAHLREAAAGSNGPDVFELHVDSSDDRSGTFEGSFDLTDAQESVYNAGLFYVVIYSTQFPDGELRGQLSP